MGKSVYSNDRGTSTICTTEIDKIQSGGSGSLPRFNSVGEKKFWTVGVNVSNG